MNLAIPQLMHFQFTFKFFPNHIIVFCGYKEIIILAFCQFSDLFFSLLLLSKHNLFFWFFFIFLFICNFWCFGTTSPKLEKSLASRKTYFASYFYIFIYCFGHLLFSFFKVKLKSFRKHQLKLSFFGDTVTNADPKINFV